VTHYCWAHIRSSNNPSTLRWSGATSTEQEARAHRCITERANHHFRRNRILHFRTN